MPATIINDPVICDGCRDRVVNTIRVDDRLLCPYCTEGYPQCESCGNCAESTTTTVEGEDICRRCWEQDYGTCDCCERPATYLTVATAGRAVCESCEDTCYQCCDYCGDLVRTDEDCDCRPAEDCGEYIHDYCYRPLPEFHGAGPLYLGFELEINTPELMLRDCAEIATQRLGSVGYLKEDSSINDDTGYGFELVTHPMSFRWALAHFPWPLLAELAGNGCNGLRNGLHVHISRAAFASPAHIYRWMKLLYRNEDSVITLARRYSPGWANFTAAARRAVKDYAKGASGLRYQAINTCPPDTFELRIFASTLNQQEVQAALALAEASVEYTRTLTVSDITVRGGWDWATFARWVDERPQYAPLSREMERLSCAC